MIVDILRPLRPKAGKVFLSRDDLLQPLDRLSLTPVAAVQLLPSRRLEVREVIRACAVYIIE